MPSSGIIDLAIGLAFVFGVTAALSSAVTELIARFLGLRGAYLLTGLRELVDSGDTKTVLSSAADDFQALKDIMSGGKNVAAPSVTGALLGSPILGSQGMTGQISGRSLTLTPPATPSPPGTAAKKASSLPKVTTAGGRPWSLWGQLRSLPSYISSKSFAEAVVDMLVPDPAAPGKASGTVEPSQSTMSKIEASLGNLPPEAGMFKSSLQALVKNADGDVTKFRTSVEGWYDDHMDRVSGWYKRRTAKITLVFGAVLVILLNVNALTIGRTLYTQSTVSAALSSVAASSKPCPAGGDQLTCLTTLQGDLSAVASAGLPIGWGTVRDCTEKGAQCNWWDQRGILSQHGNSAWQLLLVLAGFMIMIIGIIPGARFWFGLLSKL